MKHFRHAFHDMYSDQRGFVLVMTLILAAMISAMAATYGLAVRTDTVLRGAAGRERHGFYAAEAGLNKGMAEFGTIFQNYDVPTSSDYTERTVSVGDRTVSYQLAPVLGVGSCTDANLATCYVTIPAGEPFAGLQSIAYRYAAQATAVNAEGDVEAELGAQFDVHNIPIFQFLAYYANNLEILPGPNMNLTGRIHTNGDLYLNSNATMTIGDRPVPPNPPPGNPFVQISAAGNVFRGRLDDTSCGGTVIIDALKDNAPADGNLDPITLPCSGGSAVVPEATIGSYLGSIMTNNAPMQMPSVDELKRGDGTFWENADFRIVLRLQNPAPINFNAPSLCPGGPGTLLSPALFPIEVQKADGTLDAAKTTQLQRFMCERRGAIFYNDVPTTAVNGNPNENVARDRNDYAPNFGGTADGTNSGNEQLGPNAPNEQLGPNAPAVVPVTDYRVYRRVGEDTNGSGVINNNDFNPHICPVGIGVAPWWRPAYCPWPNNLPPGGETLWFRDMDYRRGGYYNHREEKWMYLLNVNMRALIEWNEFNGDPLFAHDDTTDGGLVIFLSVQGAASDTFNNYGVRVFDSADLDMRNTTLPNFNPDTGDPTGLTLVSDQALYVQGNYNSFNGQTRGQKQPAALIADTLNVLSQSWETPRVDDGNWRANDRKSVSATWNHRRVLTADTPCGTAGCGPNLFYGINAAFLAQVDNTVGGNYNGGLENYPRFHENWSSRTLVYRGSYVSLGNPVHANGSWLYGGPVYEAPGRNWDYDVDFNRVEALPPLTPKVTYVQQRLYTRFYE